MNVRRLSSRFCPAALCFAAIWLCLSARPTHRQEERFKKHIYTLAGEEFAGRGSQTEGDTLSVRYIREFLRRQKGMELLFGDGIQTFTSNSRDGRVTSFNVAGMIPGNDPELRNEIILVGAHYDHMGWQFEDFEQRILYGADDNASGTAMVLELARHFSRHRKELKRSVAFIFFGAEEKGLVGSAYFLDHLPFDKERIAFMVNMDMVGRLTTERGLKLLGTGNAEELDSLIRTVADPLEKLADVELIPQNESASDQQTFHKAGIPVLFFNTGIHTDYHRSTDIPEAINYYGMALICDYAKDIILQLANTEKITPYGKKTTNGKIHE